MTDCQSLKVPSFVYSTYEYKQPIFQERELKIVLAFCITTLKVYHRGDSQPHLLLLHPKPSSLTTHSPYSPTDPHRAIIFCRNIQIPLSSHPPHRALSSHCTSACTPLSPFLNVSAPSGTLRAGRSIARNGLWKFLQELGEGAWNRGQVGSGRR